MLRLQDYAQKTRTRITFLSGDVHCAAVGLFETHHKDKKTLKLPQEEDHRYMLNIVTSEWLLTSREILTNSLFRRHCQHTVRTFKLSSWALCIWVSETCFRPPNAVISLVSHRSTKTHSTLHHAQTDETMVCCMKLSLRDILSFASSIPCSWKTQMVLAARASS